MATYVFEEMQDSDAVAFDGSTDRLFFNSATVGTLGVVDHAGTSGPLGTTNETITLTYGTISHTFVAAELADASTANNLIFVHGGDGDALAITNDTTAAGFHGLDDADVGGHVAIYGLDGDSTLVGTVGNDTINGGAGDDSIVGSSSGVDADGNFIENDFLQGGNGDDTIIGGEGNDHIYGNLFSSTAGAADGDDFIDAGNGNDYVNGNLGDDTVHGGIDNDRIYGGGGADKLFGDDGNDYLQGNKGADTIDGGNGIDVIHGGADSDSLLGGNGNDQLFGDNGNDVIAGGNGYDQLWGGAGNDTFNFGAGEADNANVHTAATATNHGVVETINDFEDGKDVIHLTFAPAADANIHHTAAGATFTDAAAAQDYAQTLLTGHGSDVAAITVGSDTYLFYDDTHTTGTINSAIKIVGVTDAAFTHTDFA